MKDRMNQSNTTSVYRKQPITTPQQTRSIHTDTCKHLRTRITRITRMQQHK